MPRNQLPMALSVEKMRQEMLRGVRIPKSILNRALTKTAKQLDAKETKFFTHQGVVVETRDVVAHDIQAAATDRIFSLAGLYAKDREPMLQTPQVTVEVDQQGVVRLIVGGPPQALPPPPEALTP